MNDSHGKIIHLKLYTRDMIRRTPSVLYVFGDNVARVGYGGQAAAARGEPNAVGIVTKMSPSLYLDDSDFEIVKPVIVDAFNRLAKHLVAGGNIVWPKDGVGTGLASLQSQAPTIFVAIERCKEHLLTYASSVISE